MARGVLSESVTFDIRERLSDERSGEDCNDGDSRVGSTLSWHFLILYDYSRLSSAMYACSLPLRSYIHCSLSVVHAVRYSNIPDYFNISVITPLVPQSTLNLFRPVSTNLPYPCFPLSVIRSVSSW